VNTSPIAVTSMTGYARAEGRCAMAGMPVPFNWVWEAKSVNGKGLDVRIRVPTGFDSLELSVRQAATAALSRGSLTVNLQVTSDTSSAAPKLNETLLDAAIALAMKKAAALPPRALGTILAPARLDGLMALRGVFDSADAPVLDAAAVAARDQEVLKGVALVLDRLTASRRGEGARLAPVMGAHMDEIDRLTAEARAVAATQPAALAARMSEALAVLTTAVPALTPERLAQEVALLVLKADVREELDRLAAHVAQARELLGGGAPCGRKLEFLSQEFNREVNTLCSKSTDLTLTRLGLALKAAVDQFREQIQNIE
jgi:uncharacterized protein (TIGR00255 family)